MRRTMQRLLAFIVCVIMTSNAQTPVPTETYPHEAVLDANDNIFLFWKFDFRMATIEVHAKTTAWVGVGISPNGGMIGADIIVGWVKNGTAFISDRHGPPTANSFPPADDVQDVELIEGSETEGWTMLKFKRHLAACEKTWDLPITADTTKIIWAIGPEDPAGDDLEGPMNYHGGSVTQRGTKSLLFLEATGRSQSTSREVTASLEFLNDNFEIPSEDTYYNCKMMKFPKFTRKHHIVKIEPAIQKGNEPYVHHILLYQCNYTNPQNASALGVDTKCYSSSMPPDYESCDMVIHGWAIGGGTFYYPEHVGFPLGTDDAPSYIVMETHYDNPLKRAGIVDSSGLRITYTSQLREYDASVLQVGHSVNPYSNLIPPNAKSYLAYGECPADCMTAGMNKADVTEVRIFGTLLHSHLLGRKLTLRHIQSDGIELPYIAQDNSYDFNYQEVRFSLKEHIFKKGESMQLVCDYQTIGDRTNFTTGGLGTTEEMCLAYVYYYPKLSLTKCETAPLPNHLLKYFGITDFVYLRGGAYGTLDDILVTDPQSLAEKTVGDVINNLSWDQNNAEKLSAAVRNMPRYYTCESKVKLEGIPLGGAALQISSRFVPPEVECGSSPPSSRIHLGAIILTWAVSMMLAIL